MTAQKAAIVRHGLLLVALVLICSVVAHFARDFGEWYEIEGRKDPFMLWSMMVGVTCCISMLLLGIKLSIWKYELASILVGLVGFGAIMAVLNAQPNAFSNNLRLYVAIAGMGLLCAGVTNIVLTPLLLYLRWQMRQFNKEIQAPSCA